MIRRLLLAFVVVAAAVLLPWTWYLAHTLPDRFDTAQWRLAWVGFDIALAGCFASTAWLGWRRRRAALPLMAATAALLCCDAWFDVVLDSGGADWWVSALMAGLVELPIAGFLAWRARHLLVGGMPSRALTPAHIDIHASGSDQALLRQLNDGGPADLDTLAAALDRPAAELRDALDRLRAAGLVRRRLDRRWRSTPLDLRMPRPEEVDEAIRPQVRAYLDAKYDRERRILTRAARERERLGVWGRAHRAAAHLTEAELDRFDTELNDLIIRYCLLHDRPSSGTRRMALRYYGFPAALMDEVDQDSDSAQPAV
jgi:hypothetical protein